ncbi:MAG TPA: carboxypeptidase regulatory-like domain-containing protein [Vicinamibacterales bacterium]|nr:carboxypeptidase regulatory-like domain-containing protein [Vicinamibacterales bacterium]
MLTAVGRTTLAMAATALVLSAGVPAAQSSGGPVRGHVEIGIPVSVKRPTAAAYPGRSIEQAQLAPASEIRNVVVFLKDAPARSQAPVHGEIRQIHETFVPRVVAIPVGSTVDFPNDDDIYHNVFSLSTAKNFNLGRYPRGKSRKVTFDKPGLVRVFCDIHSHMSATIVVFNHPWFAIPDEQGNFQLPDMPPGDHQITAWHERLGETTRSVRVDAGRSTIQDFTLPVPAK